MISLRKSQLSSFLPYNLRKNNEAVAFCETIDIQIKKILDFTENLYIWSDISKTPEWLLDYLSVELRVQFYKKELPIQVKRNLIRNALIWYEKIGTKKVLQEMLEYVFGEGEVQEWFEYGGKPGYFRIITPNMDATGTKADEYKNLIETVKRKTAKLDAILVGITEYTSNLVGVGMYELEKETYKVEL